MSAAPPIVEATVVPLAAILEMREAYRREMACQIVHDSWHARGFTTSYLLRLDGPVAGYGSVGGAPGEPRDTVKELYLRPESRGAARDLFRALVAASGARWIEAQTNDPILHPLLRSFGGVATAQKLLFGEGTNTRLSPAGAGFRAIAEEERDGVFEHAHEPVGEYGVALDGVVVATGGLAHHYNPPYSDLFMEVDAGHRRRGLGSYLVQELKRVCREIGRVPAARCDPGNEASRRTLERAGMVACGRIERAAIAI